MFLLFSVFHNGLKMIKLAPSYFYLFFFFIKIRDLSGIFIIYHVFFSFTVLVKYLVMDEKCLGL